MSHIHIRVIRTALSIRVIGVMIIIINFYSQLVRVKFRVIRVIIHFMRSYTYYWPLCNLSLKRMQDDYAADSKLFKLFVYIYMTVKE